VSAVLLTPSAWQKRYQDCDVDELLGAGSAGPGKTEKLISEPLPQVQIEHARCMRDPSLVAAKGTKLWKLIEENPLNWGESKGWALFLRRTSPRLVPVQTRMMKLFPVIDPDARYEVQHSIWHFKSGYRYQLGHCHDRDDWLQYQGAEITILLFDELIEFEEEQYDQICTRLRTTDPVLKHFLKVRSMSNPVMRRTEMDNVIVNNPMWVRDRFVKEAPQGGVRMTRTVDLGGGDKAEVSRMYLPATLDDHPDKEYVRQYKIRLLSSGKEHIVNALLKGDWWAIAGSYFADVWDAKMHVCRPFKIPSDWPQFRALDWGFKHPGCCLWFAIDPDKNLYVHKELNFQGKTARDVAIEIREIEKGMGLWSKKGSRITGPADTQLWEERGDEGLKKVSEMVDEGVRWVQANKKSRARNGMRVHERLKATEQGSHEGGMYIFETCNKLVRTLPGIQTDSADPQGETPGKANDDDAFDTCMYGVEYVSRHENPPMLPQDEGILDDWPEDEVSGVAERDEYTL
jgi:hypothetical protein